MKRIYKLIVAIVVITNCNQAIGQSISPFILNGAGGSKQIGSIIYDYSVGEMTLVSTFYGSNVTLTQGLLQNEKSVPVGVVNTAFAQNTVVYPNPSSSVVNIKFNSPNNGNLTYRLLDMTGKTLISKELEVSYGVMNHEINIAPLAVATYMLEITFSSGGINETNSYKIEKIK